LLPQNTDSNRHENRATIEDACKQQALRNGRGCCSTTEREEDLPPLCIVFLLAIIPL
jgi:hypothetical protein